MPKRILVDPSTFPIQPNDINIDYNNGFQHLFGAFDNMETENSAYWVIKLCQRLGTWGPFSEEQIQELYQKKFPHGRYGFNRLVDPQSVFANPVKEFERMAEHAVMTRAMDPMAAGLSYAMAAAAHPADTVLKGGGWIALGTDGKYYVTDDFVTSCFKSSPVSSKKKAAVAV